MPAIDIQVMTGVFSAEEKARIITAVTEGFGSVAGETLQANTSVRIHEIQSGAWGYGGAVLTTEDARRMRIGGDAAD
ncbi:tautomerase family protein [Roseivivax sediminis]|uniref:4-oxalocrotonate tautomerase n=1 Tax=Roseivivax sediminis TaxID=936889 RepID=A0A1I1VHN5_9RHOB|nr:tautomerase family protein [Roseivivax sediminis]SFD82275.1 4-oxalocrotonate tautomerase [Roseivivax sediminis]